MKKECDQVLGSGLFRLLGVMSVGMDGRSDPCRFIGIFGVFVVLTASCAPYVSVEEIYADPSPVLEMDLTPEVNLGEQFPEFEETEVSESDDRLQRVMGYYLADRSKDSAWSASIAIEMYKDVLVAERERVRWCAFWGRQFGSGKILRVGNERGAACVSAVFKMRNDPEGLYLPSGEYVQFVGARRGEAVVFIWATARAVVALDPLIADIADRMMGRSSEFVYGY